MGYICRHCGATNDEAGHCILCGKQMGSIQKAINAAFLSSGVLCALWVAVVYITKVEFSFFAIFFGGLVSAAVVIHSHGRGFVFQIIAWVFTVLGIVAANTYGIYLLWSVIPEYYESGPRPSFFDLAYYLMVYDDITAFFYILGILGGSWIWIRSD